MDELQRKAIAHLLRRAAKLIENSVKSNDADQIDGMCNAISWANRRGATDWSAVYLARNLVRRMYFPSCQRWDEEWWYAPPYQEMEARIVALCFAADVLESGEEL